ncbi:MAG: hypothetical protein IJ757_03245 [Clostridiales bacterium]|nr:hypothetical protein [Clostridiales bacterium]
MSDNNNRQWFEDNNDSQDRRRVGGKKSHAGERKSPADPSRKHRSARKSTAQSGKQPPRPNNNRPNQPGKSNQQKKPNQPNRPNQPDNAKGAPVSSKGKPHGKAQPQEKGQSKGQIQSQGKSQPKGNPQGPKKGQQASKPQQSKKPQQSPENIKKNDTPVTPAIPLKGSKEDLKQDKKAKKNAKPTPDEIRKKSSRRKALVSSGVAIGLVLAGIMVLFFVVHHLFDYFAVKPNLEFVTNGTIEHTIGSRAIIVRDESVVLSNHGGDFVTEAAEGSRVAAGQSIAMVVPADMQTVVENLRNTQSQISDVQQELIAEGSAEGADVIYRDIDQSLTPIVNMLRLDSINGNLSELSSYSSSISVLLNQRETELAGLAFDDERLRVLRSDERGYQSQLENRASVIYAPEPGIVSFKLDGLETVINYEVLLNADAGTIRDYINGAVGVIPSVLTVQAGDNVARIASNDEQYIACFLNESDAPMSAFEVGSSHTVIVGSEGLSIGKCIVRRVTPTSNGNYLVVFSTTRYVENLLDVRSADIEVVITETRGMRVPVSSLVNPDYSRGVATLYINNQGFCTEVGVLIEDYDREFAIIKPIGDVSVPNLQTVYITNPGSVNPGDQVS